MCVCVCVWGGCGGGGGGGGGKGCSLIKFEKFRRFKIATEAIFGLNCH